MTRVGHSAADGRVPDGPGAAVASVSATAPEARSAPSEPLTVERVVGFEPPREYRLHPRDRSVAYTDEAGGARQLFVLSLRGGSRVQVTASELDISDPQWSPDGRRLAFVRNGAIWVVDADGSRQVRVTEHPAANTRPRWSPDGHRLAFISRRRGWSQIWLIDAPIPRRGRPATNPKPAEPAALTAVGLDVDEFCWSPDGLRIALASQREDHGWWSAVSVVEVAGGAEARIAPGDAWECGPSWTADGSLLFLSDADGWFQVVRLDPGLRERTVMTVSGREHGEPGGSFGLAPLASPDDARFVHLEIHDGIADLVVAPMAGRGPVKRPRGRPPKHPRPVAAAGPGPTVIVNPWPGRWLAVDWTADSGWIAAIGESERRPQDLWLLPVPGVAPDGSRPRRVTDTLPAVLRSARFVDAERVGFAARDGLRIEGNLFRPAGATGKRGGRRVPTVLYLHGGPTWQSYLTWMPFKQVLVREGYAVLDVDFRGSSGYGRQFRLGNVGEWGHADAHDCIDAARWAAAQPWSDGRTIAYGGSYGGYLVMAALVEEPGLWAAGVDLYGDSDIAESYRRADRPGRRDLHRMMGAPDDPAHSAEYERGSPVHRAERIEAPLLLLHGRKDKRVVPLMTERMVEALVIEDKLHEVHWYDDEAHGWVRRENRRDSWNRILTFLRQHVPERPARDKG
jgi:dipeptidyl aminopeptidase/acylaminoacyl peptidase